MMSFSKPAIFYPAKVYDPVTVQSIVKPATPVALIIMLFPLVTKSISEAASAGSSMKVSSGMPTIVAATPDVLTKAESKNAVDAGVDGLKPAACKDKAYDPGVAGKTNVTRSAVVAPTVVAAP